MYKPEDLTNAQLDIDLDRAETTIRRHHQGFQYCPSEELSWQRHVRDLARAELARRGVSR